MEKSFVSKKNFVRVLDAVIFERSGGHNEVELNKGANIIELVQANEKFDQFITTQFLEKYVKYIYNYRSQIIKKNLENHIKEYENEDLIININEEEFGNIINKITFDGDHLSEDQIKEATTAFKKLKSNRSFDVIISYKFIRDYVIYLYQNRYQIRKNLSKRINKLEKDEEGDYLIDDSYIVRDNNDGGKNSPFWISIERNEEDDVSDCIAKDIVVKNMFNENKKETALIAEEIARELKLPVAQYYPAKYIGKKYKTNGERAFNDNRPYVSDRIVITPNFLEEGEELITGDRIAGTEMDIKEMPKLIREYFSKIGLEKNEIEDLVSEFKLVMVFNCFINHRDGHNGNWGFIKKADGKYKISHIFDLEGSLCENKQKIRAIFIGDYMDDEHLLYELLQDDKVRDRARKFLDLDIRQVIDNVRISKGVRVSRGTAIDVFKLIWNQKKILKKTIKNVAKEKVQERNFNKNKNKDKNQNSSFGDIEID